MSGPDRSREYVKCGPNLEPLEPTPHLRIGFGDVLEQWHEAKCTAVGVTTTVGQWMPVPRRSY